MCSLPRCDPSKANIVVGTKDAPEVTAYEESFNVSPSKIVVNVLQDDIIKYANFHFSIAICSKISSLQRPLPSRILRLNDRANKM